MMESIVKYLGLYGFSVSDLVFSLAALCLIIGLTKLYTKRKTSG